MADSVDVSGFLAGQDVLVDIFKIIPDEINSMVPENCYLIANSFNYVAVSSGGSLSIHRFDPGSGYFVVVAELEFDCSLVVMSWDLMGEFLVLGDCNGLLHLIAFDGTLLFSKKVASGMIYLSFYILL